MAFDTTRFVEVSIREVLITLVEAMILVFLVVYLFLQSWRAAIIPFAAVPVALIGTFAGILMLGYSINTLTLFAMVLSIGIVVDDAIVVLENVERIMREEHLSPRDASVKAMNEVTGPIIAIVLTLVAVFVPIAFLGGLTGELYRQFAVTISISVVISGVVALTLSPALCALILKPHVEPRGFFRWFNRWFESVTNRYSRGVAFLIRHGIIALTLFALMVGGAVLMWRITPGSLVPDEDQGFYITAVILPDGATLERTQKVVDQVQEAIRSNPNNQDVIAFTGFDFIGGGFRNNAATLFVTQVPWDDRKVTAAAARGRALRQDRAHQGSARAGVQSAADLRPRHHRGLRVLHPEPRRRRLGAAQRGQGRLPRPRQRGQGAGRRADALARRRAAALHRRRPRQGQEGGRAHQRHLRHAVGDDGHVLRQRLQQVRPHVAGADVLRAGSSARSPTTSPACSCAATPARWCRCPRS